MKILVDADSCPVKDIIIKLSKEFNIPIIFFMDTCHLYNPQSDLCEVVTVDKGFNSVDIALVNKLQPNDIVVSQDYGVAAMALSKRAYVINPSGLVYTKDNIDKLLFERHLSQKVRRSGGKTSNTKKRNNDLDIVFESKFKNLCIKALENS